MDTYSLMREIADSWVLLLMFVFFIGTWLFAFWPSMKADRKDAANIPFRNETFDEETGDLTHEGIGVHGQPPAFVFGALRFS
ncbi:MAG: cbb3-type cytochrome c oxidase subunit 3, partial [Pseudomonadota bacterium]